MPGELVPRSTRIAPIAAAAGALALIPSVVLIGFGVLGLAVPRIVTHPIVVLGGVAFALVVNVAASFRLRAEATEDGLAIECDLRLRYRGANRVVIIAAGTIAALILVYLIGENFGPR